MRIVVLGQDGEVFLEGESILSAFHETEEEDDAPATHRVPFNSGIFEIAEDARRASG